MKTKDPAKTAAALPRGKAQYVLLVEDDHTLRKHLAQILEIGGYRVTGAENGRTALNFLSGAPIDLVITDVTMPEMDGYELACRMAEQFPKIPVLVMSGAKAQIARFNETHTPNVRKVLHKPVSLETLISSVVEVFTQPQP